jgi:cyclopropane fatty-acyl-phospholipid synthase-like methyltransferase
MGREKQMKNDHTISVWNGLAEKYRDTFMDLDLYNDSYDRFLEKLPLNAKVLEIGCGPGNITRYLYTKRNDLNILATDAAPNMVKMAATLVNGPEFRVMHTNEIAQLNEKFDAVICGFVAPYLSPEECGKLFRDVRALLKNDGVFYFSFVDDDPEKPGPQKSSDGKHEMQLYFHREEQIGRLLEVSGFSSRTTLRKNYILAEKPEAIHVIVISSAN